VTLLPIGTTGKAFGAVLGIYWRSDKLRIGTVWKAFAAVIGSYQSMDTLAK